MYIRWEAEPFSGLIPPNDVPSERDLLRMSAFAISLLRGSQEEVGVRPESTGHQADRTLLARGHSGSERSWSGTPDDSLHMG